MRIHYYELKKSNWLKKQVIKSVFFKLFRNPVRYLKHIVIKFIITSSRYISQNNYDAKKYWEDRFQRHGESLIAVGDEGMDLKANRAMYKEAAQKFLNVLDLANFDLSSLNILEIGCGTGFFTEILKTKGAVRYTGFDITATFFHKLKIKFPSYQFIQGDITQSPPQGQFDLIVIIDVIEHIVTEKDIHNAMHNINSALKQQGHLIISPVFEKRKKLHFHVCLWDEEFLLHSLPNLSVEKRIPFRNSTLLLLKKS